MSAGEVTQTVSIAARRDGPGLRVARPGLVVLFTEPGNPPASSRTAHGAAVRDLGPETNQRASAAPRLAYAVQAATRVGRDATCELCLPDQHVSRLHAVVEPRASGLLIRDQGSHNGTGAWVVAEPGELSSSLSSSHIRTAIEVPFDSVLRMGNTLLWVTGDVEPFFEAPAGLTLLGGPWLNQLLAPVRAALSAGEPMLLEGETGTGKERMAHELHVMSGRAGAFVAVNCAALPAELFESELFGHTRGAFSGSEHSRPGLFRSADAGTLLLDEIGELPLPAQAKLLRVLEERAVRPVGQDRPEKVDVRVLAATNRDLGEMCSAGQFRADLFHRLTSNRLRLPPLRQRRYDIPDLASHFILSQKLTPAPSLTAAAMEHLLARAWPGNARELRNTVRAAALVARSAGRQEILAEDVLDLELDLAPPSTKSYASPARDAADARELAGGGKLPGGGYLQSGVHPRPSTRQAATERERLITALELCAGNVAEVARRLNLRRARLYELFNQLDIDPARFRPDK